MATRPWCCGGRWRSWGHASELAGNVAVVTGAASGLGRGIAEAFVREGLRVVIADVDGTRLDVEVARLGALGGDVIGVVTDVGDPDAVEAAQGAVTAAPARTRKPQRTHRGRTLDERRAERRSALLDAALDLFGTKGYGSTSIGELCRESYVTARYFYEEFGDKEALLVAANRAAIAATIFLAAGMSASVYLITDFLFGEPATAAVTATLGALFIWLWYGLPLIRRMRERD